MARETKQDRIIRGMLDQVTEHLLELKNLEANPTAKESDVERWVQGFLKNCLGYMASGGYQIRAQEAKGKHRPDLVIFKEDKAIVLVEVKKLGFDLNKSDFRSGKVQISEYLQNFSGVKWGILTNGTDWKLYDFSNPQLGGVEVTAFDLKEDDQPIEVDKRAVEEICYSIFDMHEHSFQSGAWQELSKEATVFSPESLARAIMSQEVVRYIAKSIRGEHEYKANFEVLCDRIHILLELGLNDAHVGWNEAKAIELNKYVKSQKRAGRKTRRQKRTVAVAPVVEASPADPTTAESPQPVVALATKPEVA